MSEYQWPPFMSIDSPSPQSAYPDNHASWPMVDTWVEETHSFDDEYSAAYIHRDAARAWQAVRDWLNGTPEQWVHREVVAYSNGYEVGRIAPFDCGSITSDLLSQGRGYEEE